MALTNRNPGAGSAGALNESVPEQNDRISSAKNDGPQPILIGEFPANSRETARVTLDNFKGHDLVCIRKWYPGDDGKLRPGKGGITVNVRHLPKLAELIAAALAAARHSGLIPSDGGAQ
jgi:hypothetical protein